MIDFDTEQFQIDLHWVVDVLIEAGLLEDHGVDKVKKAPHYTKEKMLAAIHAELQRESQA